MKILHTGDWHIGKLVHGIHMTEDQKYLLDQLMDLIIQEKPDVMIVAGDIYDRSIPPVEAVEVLDSFLSEAVLTHKLKIIAIAGNHDSSNRVGFASRLLMDQGLHIHGNIRKVIVPIVIEDENGPVYFYPIPYGEPAIIREIYDDESIKDHETAMKRIISDIQANKPANGRHICIAHGFVMGAMEAETSESERPLSIGGSEYVDVRYFEGFDYVALGHLHKPQKVKHEHIRYAGSLLKYSFSEANQKKSMTMVDMDGSGSVTIKQISLNPLKDMRIIKGKLENLMDPKIYAGTNTKDYIMAILTDRGEIMDAIGKLRSIYPNILKIEREVFEREAGMMQTSAGHAFAKKSILELFGEFYENVSAEAFTDEKRDVIAGVMNALEQEGRAL
ncbi:Nuclease SbcCD subunit D [Petrocella atlantisensis]|uniref:Nuclease SbcCD subunit D n=1 Tax=Petrocella atlantisensis TaxID=2173034 RepID=A0A3P7PF37_9FIRM|nr:exonuclease SbcCD subunit D [Petrocella atlantisensis]VDN48693.1 Nuclease SbcCD subunit D [Petrocella atlantisensis]